MMEKIEAEHRPWLENLPRAGDSADLCPLCDARSTTAKKQISKAGLVIRYRVCEKCGCRYKTVELLAFGNRVSLRDRTKDVSPGGKGGRT